MEYKKIVCFGDIHGCVQPLLQYFNANPYSHENYYIFLGDYISRGVQNQETIEFLYKIAFNDNVKMLLGNHELHIIKMMQSPIYKDVSVIPYAINEISIISSLSDSVYDMLVKIVSHCVPYFYFKINDTQYICTHGGLPTLPSILTSELEIILGVGTYGDSEIVDNNFSFDNMHSNTYSIHGHRNVYAVDIHNTAHTFNLNDIIEYGGSLRILEITKESISQMKILNTIHAERSISSKIIHTKTDNELVESLNNDKHIIKKKLDDDIISYSFNRDIFFSKDWNNINCKARGLFLRGDKIIARSYDKFFNYMELRETQPLSLKSTLQYPIDVYNKENGFLGLVSLDRETNKLFIASKSTNKGEFADIVREQFSKLECANDISNWLTDNDKTLIFEVIDPIKDPHIIEYDKPQMILLDIVDNSFETHYMLYDELVKFAQKYKLNYKFKCKTLNNFEEVIQYIENIEADKIDEYEGVVFRDVNSFQFKLKTPFYNKWKYFRSIKDKYCRGTLRQVFKDKEEVDFVNYLKTKDIERLQLKSIIDVRNEIKQEK